MTSYTEGELIVNRSVDEELRESYLRYSMSVIISRALPDVRDGLKPSQRRILFAMKQLNLSPGAKHRKCAKICGDTSGDYHPHGEMVIYPTLVRMAQDWAMRYTLVNGQGNFGSIDGDPAAQMRYTEARLTHAATELMEDLDKETVDYVSNYDETKKEPTVFPSKFPNLLCNGSSGIAVGMATNIPPHNLLEVIKATHLVLDNPRTTVDEIMQVMPGPDFPTGGIICGYRGIKEAFHTGRGKLTLRGLVTVEENPDHADRQRLVITEIPYNVNKSRLIEQIADNIQNKVITGISDLRDESDRDGMRIVIELKKGEMTEIITNQLYKYSDLEVTFGCNMLALDKGVPRMMTAKQMIVSWIEHRMDVVRKRTRYELAQAEARAHILEGYLKALDCLDEVVKLIRASSSREEAKIGLMSTFGFTERQANAILDLRLYQLTGLEHDKISSEYNALLEKIRYFKEILGSEQRVKEIIKDELAEIQKHHKSERRTQIIAAEADMDMEDLIPNEQVIVTISNDDYIKRMHINLFREQRRGGQGVTGIELKKEADAIKNVHVASTHDYMLVFTQFGRLYWLKVWQIPDTGRRSKGKPLINLLELQEGEKIATTVQTSKFSPETFLLMATKKGVVKKISLDEFSNPRRKGIIALEIDEGDELTCVRHVAPGQEVMLFTKNGMAVRFDESEVRATGRTSRGVRGVSLRDDNDEVVGCEIVTGTEVILVVCENGFGKKSEVEEFRKCHRAGVGVRSIITNERNGGVVGALTVTDTDNLLMMSKGGQTIRIRLEDVRVMGRNTQGVRLANLKDDILVAVQKIARMEGETDEGEVLNGAEVPIQEGAIQEEAIQEDVIQDSESAE